MDQKELDFFMQKLVSNYRLIFLEENKKEKDGQVLKMFLLLQVFWKL